MCVCLCARVCVCALDVNESVWTGKCVCVGLQFIHTRWHKFPTLSIQCVFLAPDTYFNFSETHTAFWGFFFFFAPFIQIHSGVSAVVRRLVCCLSVFMVEEGRTDDDKRQRRWKYVAQTQNNKNQNLCVVSSSCNRTETNTHTYTHATCYLWSIQLSYRCPPAINLSDFSLPWLPLVPASHPRSVLLLPQMLDRKYVSIIEKLFQRFCRCTLDLFY